VNSNKGIHPAGHHKTQDELNYCAEQNNRPQNWNKFQNKCPPVFERPRLHL
jgi:hypothetical protein